MKIPPDGTAVECGPGMPEPGYLWEILESNDAGKHRFNYRAWPTSPRYEVSTKDGWQQTGSDVDLCNRIIVTYNDPATGSTPVTGAPATRRPCT